MQLYFNSTASGGTGDHDFVSPSNFWLDPSWTMNAGTLPTSSDDVQLDDYINIMLANTDCHNLTSSNQGSFDIQNFNSNSGLFIHGVVTGVNFSGPHTGSGYIIGSSGTLFLSGCSINNDWYSININGSSGCTYNIDLSSIITDDGSATWGAFTFSGVITATGAGINATSASIFTSTVTSTAITGGTYSGTVNCSDISGGDFGSSTVNQTGDISFYGFTGTPTVNWTSPLNIIQIQLGYAQGLGYAGFNPNYPGPSYVYTGITTGGQTGSLTLPTAAQIQSGVVCGIGGNSLTGTFSGGSSVVGYFG